MRSLQFRKAATMLFLRHANLPNYDPKTKRLLCVRTEGSDVIRRYGLGEVGVVQPSYPRDSHASYSWFQTCTPTNGNNLVAVSVPISRITSCDLFTQANGKNLFNLFHRNETEVGTNAFGLPFVYLGKTDSGVPISSLFGKIAEAEKKSGKTLDGRVFKDDKEYRRISAPWAREVAVNEQ